MVRPKKATTKKKPVAKRGAQPAATPDGRTLVTVSWDKTVRLWDVAALCAGAVG